MLEALTLTLYTTHPWAVLGIGIAIGAASAMAALAVIEAAKRNSRGVAHGR